MVSGPNNHIHKVKTLIFVKPSFAVRVGFIYMRISFSNVDFSQGDPLTPKICSGCFLSKKRCLFIFLW